MSLRLLLSALLMMVACGYAHAVTEVTGTTPGGAAYRIAVPDSWEAGDPLVLVQQPYSHSRITNPTLGALRDTQLAEGFAVAASGYRQGGWALFTALDDNAELVDAFTTRFGAPGALYTTGQRMGGLVALKLAEDPRFRDRTRGVLATCPIVDGVQFWDQKFDVRLILDRVCAGVSGRPPVGSEPYSWATNLADIPPGMGSFDNQAGDFSQANYCLGLGAVDVVPQAGWQERKALVKSLTRIEDDNALLAHASYAVFGLGDLVRAPDKFAGSNPFLNEAETPFGLFSVPYGHGAAGIQRVRAYDLFARQRFDLSSRLDGSATARIVGIATSKDEISDRTHIRALSSIYPGVHPAAHGERVYATAFETAAPINCGLSEAERLAAWDAVTVPVNAPTLTAHCNARIGAGASGPCRFGDIQSGVHEDITVLYRHLWPPVYDSGLVKSSSGLWFDPARDGEGLVIEELGAPVAGGGGVGAARHVLVSWYTFAPPGDRDPGPRWLIGVGTHTSQGVVVPALTQARGARFGSAFDPDDVVRSDWGSLSLVVDPFHRMRVRYDGPAGWEGSERTMAMLARVDYYVFPRFYNLVSPPLPVPPPGLESASGTYFTPARDGEGIQLQVLAGATASTRRATVLFFTYGLDGEPLWLAGLADNIPQNGGEATFTMTRADGTVFGDSFNASDVTRTPWGTLTLTLGADPDPTGTGSAGFSATAMRWNSVEAGYGSGGYALTRVTQPHVYREHAPSP